MIVDTHGPNLALRCLGISDALKVAYRADEIENIRLVATLQEAIEFRNALDRNRGFTEAMGRPVPLPVAGRYWAHLYGVEVWIKGPS